MSIDHKQYDRQIRLWGLAAQQRMCEARVLVFGFRGITSEICKNLVLAGIGHLTIIDDAIVSFEDLGCQFFLCEDDVGQRSRAEASVSNLQALNPLANVRAGKGDAATLSEDMIQGFDVVCATGMSLSDQRRVNEICRKHKVRFFATSCHGLFASLFIDLNVHDYTVEIKKKADEATQESRNESGQVVYPSLENLLHADWSSIKRASPIFYALQAQYLAFDKHGHYISAENEEGLAEVKQSICKSNKVFCSLLSPVHQRIFDGICIQVDPGVFEDDTIKMIGAQVELEISPVCAIVGGMAADQMIKSVTGKEKPLKNYFVFDGRDGMGAVYSIEHSQAA